MSNRVTKPDTPADLSLKQCIDHTPVKTFVIIAGAGSGKTTSLVKCLDYALKKRGQEYKLKGQKLACITYTEIAAKEIWDDVGNNPLAHVSTIHSFLWEVISPFQKDIKKWVVDKIDEKIAQLELKASNFGPRVQARTKTKNQADIEKAKIQKSEINQVSRFTYGTGSNYLKGILGHEDIINLVTQLITQRPLLRTIIAQKFPVVFVDESQDTNPRVFEALVAICSIPEFGLGFFGDPMQKIYLTGIGPIPLQETWQQITKPENFRSSLEVLKVINKIRESDDGVQQTPGQVGQGVLNPNGTAQIYLFPINDQRDEMIQLTRSHLARITNDNLWQTDDIKWLVIVHRMAAKRLGFENLYSAMNDEAPRAFKDGLFDGTAWVLKPFLKFVLPLIHFLANKQNFELLSILRKDCPLLEKSALAKNNVSEVLSLLQQKINELEAMINENTPLRQILNFIVDHNLLEIDSRFGKYLNDNQDEKPLLGMNEEDESEVQLLESSMPRFLNVGVNELFSYKKYIDDESPFSTQHGVKGAQFERVLNVLDDDEGTYSLYSYNKFFGIAELSDRDQERIAQGEESVIDRTRRLFYVCCSRAIKDLAVVYFVPDVADAYDKVLATGIFNPASIFTHEDITQAAVE